MTEAGLEAVIFDMDGVLCTTADYHYQSWKVMADEEGIPFTREDNEKLRGLTRRRSLEVLLGEREVAEERMQAMMDRKNTVYLELVDGMTAASLNPGIGRLLEELQVAGIRIAVASGSRNARPVLEKLGISDCVEAICDGHDIERSKPAPDPFLCAAERLGVAPERCLAIEDARAGVRSAQAAGMCVVGVGPEERVGEAFAVFRDLADVHLDDLQKLYAAWAREAGSS